MNHIALMDYRLILDLHDREMMTEMQIAERTGNSNRKIEHFFTKLQQFDEEGVADDWIRVLTFLWDVQVERGGNHYEDNLMMDIRGLFKDYVTDPVNIEAPTNDDLHWVYNQLLSEENG